MRTKQERFDAFEAVYNLSDKEKKKLGIETQAKQCAYLNICIPTYNKYRDRLNRAGDFNAQTYVRENLEKILVKTLTVIQEKGTAKHIELALKLAGLLIEKREDTLTVVSVTDRIRVASELRDELRREWEDTGSCPLCHRSEILRNQVCLHPKPKFSEDREVASLGLSTRPD